MAKNNDTNRYGDRLLKLPMSKIEKHIELIGQIEELRMVGKHAEAAELHKSYFPNTPYRDVVTPVKIINGNRPG